MGINLDLEFIADINHALGRGGDRLKHNPKHIEVIHALKVRHKMQHKGIALYMNKKQFKTPKGGVWTDKMISNIVSQHPEYKRIDGSRCF